MALKNPLEARKERPWLEAKQITQIGIANAAMIIADLGRTFRLAVPNTTAATASPARNATKSTADSSVMQYLSSHHEPRADLRPRTKMAAAKRRARLPDLSSVEMHWHRQEPGHLVDKCRSHNGQRDRYSKCSPDLESHLVLAHALGMMRKHLKDPGIRIRVTRSGEFLQAPNRTPSQLEITLATITVADVFMDELSFAL